MSALYLKAPISGTCFDCDADDPCFGINCNECASGTLATSYAVTITEDGVEIFDGVVTYSEACQWLAEGLILQWLDGNWELFVPPPTFTSLYNQASPADECDPTGYYYSENEGKVYEGWVTA